MVDINKLFSEKSWAELKTCHSDLQKIAIETRKTCPVDFSINEGARSFEKQLEYFLAGNTTLDPRVPSQLASAKHIRTPSEAFDIRIYVPGFPDLAYNFSHLAFVAGWMMATAEKLYAAGETKHLLTWGGNWDNDGILLEDQNFDDQPHFELRKPA